MTREYVFDGDCIYAPCCERALDEGLLFQPNGPDDPLEGEWGFVPSGNTKDDIAVGDFVFCPYCGVTLPTITLKDYADAGVEIL